MYCGNLINVSFKPAKGGVAHEKAINAHLSSPESRTFLAVLLGGEVQKKIDIEARKETFTRYKGVLVRGILDCCVSI